MNSQIACKLKNSFAIDSKEDLYSWGCLESGILGYDEQSDVPTPTKVTLEAYGEEYKAELISLGHFHAAAICKLKNYTHLTHNFSHAVTKVLKTFREWYEKNFIWEIPDVKSFCKRILKRDLAFKNVKFRDLKESLLETFFEHMKINKKDSFNMRSFYETNLRAVLGITGDEGEVTLEKFENIFPMEEKKHNMMTMEEKNILRFTDFLRKSHEYLKLYKMDKPYFIRFVTNFKRNITEEDIAKVLGYGFYKNSINSNDYKDEINNAAKEIFNSIYNGFSSYLRNINAANDGSGNNNQNDNENFYQDALNYKGDEGNKTKKNKPTINSNKDNDTKNNKINLNNFSEDQIPVHHLIDIICEAKMGESVLFTWGVNCDGRLGYKITPDYDLEYFGKGQSINTLRGTSTPLHNLKNQSGNQNSNSKYIMDLTQLQIYPRIVGFDGLHKIEKVACGYSHTLALTQNGHVFSWGNGKYGCLGNSKEESNAFPKLIEIDAEKKQFSDIKLIGAGMFYSIAVCKGKQIYSWGCGNNGRLGHGDEHSASQPKNIAFFEANKISVKSFSCGDTHVVIISNTDTLYSWGSGTYGKLGHGNLQDYNLPTKIESLKNSKIDIVACGSNDTIAVTSDLKVFSWGKNSSGLLGTAQPPDNNITVPALMNLVLEDAKLGIIEVSVGSMHVLLKLSNGDLFTCGSAVNGISGIKNQKEKILEPKKIPDFKCITEDEDKEDYKTLIKGYNLGFTLKYKENSKRVKFVYAVCSQDNSAFLTQNGDLFMSGKQNLIYSSDKLNNDHYENFNNETLNTNNAGMNTPFQSKINNNNNYPNESLNLTLAQTNETFNRGTPGFNPANKQTSTPNNNINQNIDLPTPGLAALDAGTDSNPNNNNNNYANTELNNFNLNSPNPDTETKPIRRIMFNQKVSYIAIAKNHAILVSEYKAFSWGKNENGILGLGDRKEKFIDKPNLIPKLPTNISMVCCSDSHSMALTMNGEIYAFGLNTYGKLGIGSLSKYLDYISKEETENAEKRIDLPIEYEPQLVKDITFAYFIACGNNHSACIMKNEETKKNCIFTWGAGYAGKLANGEPNKDVCLPQMCLSKDTCHFIRVTCGDEFTLALDQNGRLFGAGRNIYLGISKKNERSAQQDFTASLRLLAEDLRFRFISSSNHYSVALDKQGKMHGFGKIFREKLEVDLIRTEIKSLEKMKFVACGQNHFVAFGNDGNGIYTWGSNSFLKCGQDFNKDASGKVKIESKVKFVEMPRKLKLDNFERLDLNLNSDDEEGNSETNENEMNRSDEEGNDFDNEDSPINKNEAESSFMNKGNKNESKSNKSVDLDGDYENDEMNDLDYNNKNKNNKNKGKNGTVKNIRGQLQMALLQERPEQKNSGLLEEDSNLITEFYKTFSFLKNSLRNNESEYKKTLLETENNILKFLNSTSDFKQANKYHSNIPKIINMNFQIYESFLNIVQQHPCYLADLLKQINNKKIFDYLIKMIYGRSPLLLNNKRVNNLLLGLWNNIFSTDQSIKAELKNEENSSYKIYKIILNNSEQNLQVIRELIAEIFVYFINEICIYYEKEEAKGKIVINNDSNLSFTYKEVLEPSKKEELKQKAVASICNSIANYFGDFFKENRKKDTGNKNHRNNEQSKNHSDITFTRHVIWIYKYLILKEFKEQNQIRMSAEYNEKEDFFDYDNTIKDAYLAELEREENEESKDKFGYKNENGGADLNNNFNENYTLTMEGNLEKNPKIKKEFNNFLFSPFAEILKEVLTSSSDAPTKEIGILQKQILLVVEKFKKHYNKVYNLYKLDPFHFKKNYINDLLSNNSLILKDIYEIFLNLSKSSFPKDSANYEKLEQLNKQFCASINHFKWDFTLNSLKDSIKSSLEMGNYKTTIPLSVEDLITLQNYFKNYLHEKIGDEKLDPLNNILNILTNFKLADLENTSSIRNFVLNIQLKPLTYIFDFAEDSKFLRCPKCLLPLEQRFFSNFKEEKLEEVIYGKDWNCKGGRGNTYKVDNNNRFDDLNSSQNDSDEDEETSICRGHVKQEVRCKITGKYKNKSDVISKNNLFKKFYLKQNNKLLNLYEEVLYILPKMSQEDDIFKTLKKEKEVIKSLNSKTDLWKIDLIEDFITQIESSLQSTNAFKMEAERKMRLEELNNLLALNLKARREHLNYTNSIYELIDFMKSSVDNLKTKNFYFQKENEVFSEFVKRGVCNLFLLERTEKPNIIKAYQYKLKSSGEDRKFYKFNVNSLINDKVIDNVEVIKEGQSDFNQKSYLVFSKSDKGYNVRFCHRETKRKYVFCGTDNQELVMDDFVLDYEKIAELRRTAKNNPTFTIGDIRFNVFYLVKLLNSFENVN